MILRHALFMNSEETGHRDEHICIEPYRQPWLERVDDIKLIRGRVENSGLDWSSALSSGDLLFIDSSHMIRPQGDVLFEYLEVLPQLPRGVFIHVHDIFTPRDYPEKWVRDGVQFWNEQYLLEATLGNSDRYEIVAALNLLKHDHHDK